MIIETETSCKPASDNEYVQKELFNRKPDERTKYLREKKTAKQQRTHRYKFTTTPLRPALTETTTPSKTLKW